VEEPKSVRQNQFDVVSKPGLIHHGVLHWSITGRNRSYTCKFCLHLIGSCKCVNRPSLLPSKLKLDSVSKCKTCSKNLINGEKTCENPEICDQKRNNRKKEVFKMHAIIRVQHPKSTINHCTICAHQLANCTCVERPSTNSSVLNLIQKSKCRTCEKWLDAEGKKSCVESKRCRLVEEKARNGTNESTRERVLFAMKQHTEECETPSSEQISNASTKNKKCDYEDFWKKSENNNITPRKLIVAPRKKRNSELSFEDQNSIPSEPKTKKQNKENTTSKIARRRDNESTSGSRTDSFDGSETNASKIIEQVINPHGETFDFGFDNEQIDCPEHKVDSGIELNSRGKIEKTTDSSEKVFYVLKISKLESENTELKMQNEILMKKACDGAKDKLKLEVENELLKAKLKSNDC